MNSIVIIGSGNVATCLGKLFKQYGVAILGIYSPTVSHAKNLAEILETDYFLSIEEIPTDADFYLLAIKDSSVEEISNQLQVDGVVLHCSGATSIDVLNTHKKFGVMWPLQTITKNSQLTPDSIPICIEGNNEMVTNEIEQLTNIISNKVERISFEQRKYAHLAAVFANNFTNHLYEMASQILENNGLSFDLIRPIILETANKIQHAIPNETQTGPAKRNDATSIEQHLELLKKYPEFRQLYELLSAGICKHNTQ